MAKIDVEVNKIFQNIFSHGREYENKNRGVKRLQIPSYTFRHSLDEGFPAMTNKELKWKSIAGELLWFLNGHTNIKHLHENQTNIWNKDAYNWYVKFAKGNYGAEANHFYFENPDGTFRMFLLKEFVDKVKSVESVDILIRDYSMDGYTLGDCGKNYSHQWTRWGEKLGRETILVQPEPILDGRYKPTYLGIASGINKENHPLSKTWEGMISRCYDKNNISYPLYGARGVYVCNKWLSFDGFLEDVINIPNYDKKNLDHRGYVLDKDGRGNGFVYDKDSCQWITNSQNNDLMNVMEYTLEKDGIQYSFTNVSAFCREHGANTGNLCKLWTNGAKSSYGFTFIKKRNINSGINQIKDLIRDMKDDIMSSRLKVSAWNPSEVNDTALPPCHSEFQVIGIPLTLEERVGLLIKLDVELFSSEFRKSCSVFGESSVKVDVESCINECNRLNIPEFGFELHWNQRSVDTFLGLPFNIASYAMFAIVLEQLTGYIALGIEGTLKCVHFYDNQYDVARELMSRDVNKHKECKLVINNDFVGNDLDEILSNIKLSDFDLIGYTSDEALSVEMLAPKEL